MVQTPLPTEHQKTTTLKFAEWFVARQNSDFKPGNIRRITIRVWAQTNKIDVSEDDLEYIFTHWQSHIEVVN
ncbi:hypothetical protein [Alteromonas macleodii]|uniref:Uncharacterized protein n=1 Tax=Alteromonas macleodii TaxID=28108 RepID=A0AB36FNS9_ALTMA|nr:hypothetical protein [Alteromonas macleodii]OES24490.1 hypothetical protein BFV95_4757 [Alteromonas macleodii]OES25547.1 hypothetical protein BFV94_4400 [Alteromonas macleodii]OES25848.1 hypothetical protein BFV93_4311 [Alteromonas macleodii]OES38630.1 hypothetical protein BFV96_4741 [Alteromonas macleodii]